MRKFLSKTIPDRNEGNVGDIAKVGDRYYRKTKAGMWSLVFDKNLARNVHDLYVKQKLPMRTVSKELGIKHGHLQNFLNKVGWMRTHYGNTKYNYNEALQEKEQIENLTTKGYTIFEIAVSLSLTPKSVRAVQEYLGRVKSQSNSRLTYEAQKSSGRFSFHHKRAWNRLLSVDPQQLTYPQYKKAAYKLMYQMLHKYRHLYPNLKKRDSNDQYDHMISVFSAYYVWSDRYQNYIKRDKVLPLWVLSHPENLQILTLKHNRSKNTRNHQTFKQLRSKIQYAKTRGVRIKLYSEKDTVTLTRKQQREFIKETRGDVYKTKT